MKNRSYSELLEEIERVEKALVYSKSQFQKRDYVKYLKRLKNDCKEYERYIYGI